jgi:transcriptional regulator with XRE-family HTH domain
MEKRTEVPMFEPIAGNLRRERETMGLSQAQLAKKAGLSPAVVRKAESGTHSHHLATMAKIAEALGLEIATLLS